MPPHQESPAWLLDKLRQNMAWSLLVWLVVQGGGMLGIAINWQETPAYVAWSILYVILLILATAALWWLRRGGAARWRRFAQDRVVPPGLAWAVFGLIFVLWALPLEPAYPLDALRWLSTTLAGLVLIAFVRREFSPATWRVTWRVALLLLVLGTLAVGILTIDIYPQVYTDEGWNLNKSWSSAHDGPLYAPSFHLGIHGEPQLINAESIWWINGNWLRLVGLGLWQGRLFTWFFAPLTVALTFLATRTLYDRRTGVLAASFVAVSVLVLHTAHFVRHDIIVQAVMALALYLHALTEKRGRFREAFWLGIVLALAVDIHPNAFIYAFAFGVFYLGRATWSSLNERRVVRDKRLWGLMAGGVTGTVLYLAMHVAPDPALYAQQASYYYAINYGDPASSVLTNIQNRILTALDHMRSWLALSFVEGAAVLLSAGNALFLRRRTELSMLLVFGLCFVGWIVLGSRRTPTYISALVPLAAMMVGAMLASFSSQKRQVLLISALLLAAVFGMTVRRVIVAQEEGVNQQFAVCLSMMRARVPDVDEAMILGEHLFWLARPELTGYASRTLVEKPWEDRTAGEWWNYLDPDIVFWPGPVTGPAADFVTANEFALYPLPDCEPFVTIWLRPGMTFEPGG